MRGYEVWEDKGFISSSGASVIAGSTTALQETSKQLLPQKNIFALVFATGGSRRWLDEEDEGSTLGPMQPGVQGTCRQGSGGGRMTEVLMGAAAGSGRAFG